VSACSTVLRHADDARAAGGLADAVTKFGKADIVDGSS
jgi:hypothetical protein